MKHSQRGIIALGIILFAASAVCIVSLMLQFLDFGSAVQVQGSRSYVYVFGRMLFSVYGFSSLLIPLYLFGAGVVLFSAQWSKKKGCVFGLFGYPFFNGCRNRVFYKKNIYRHIFYRKPYPYCNFYFAQFTFMPY